MLPLLNDLDLTPQELELAREDAHQAWVASEESNVKGNVEKLRASRSPCKENEH